jgi:hypothetical protein
VGINTSVDLDAKAFWSWVWGSAPGLGSAWETTELIFQIYVTIVIQKTEKARIIGFHAQSRIKKPGPPFHGGRVFQA